MDFKIDKGVPLPTRGLQSTWSELLHKMDIGDSVLLEPKQMKALSQYVHIRSKGYKIATRKEGDHMRVWLIGKGKEKLVQEREEG